MLPMAVQANPFVFERDVRAGEQVNVLTHCHDPEHGHLTCQRRQWQPTPVLLPGKSHGQRSLVGCSPWGRYESDTTDAT